MHPAWGSSPLTPGGKFAQAPSAAPGGGGSVGFKGRETPPAYASGLMNRTSSGSSGGGGGGIARDMISRIRGTVMGKISGMGPGGTPSSSFSSSGSGYKFPSSDQAVEPKMRGFSKHFDPQQAEAIFSRPTIIMDKAIKGGTSPGSLFYDTLSSLPVTSLALLDTSNKKATEKNQTSQQVNAMAGIYKQAANGNLPSYDELVKDLTHAKSKSALGQAMVPPRPERTLTGYGATGKPTFKREEPDYFTPPLSTATDTLSGIFHALNVVSGMDPRIASEYEHLGGSVIDDAAFSQLKKKPSKMKSMNKSVGRQLF